VKLNLPEPGPRGTSKEGPASTDFSERIDSPVGKRRYLHLTLSELAQICWKRRLPNSRGIGEFEQKEAKDSAWGKTREGSKSWKLWVGQAVCGKRKRGPKP